MSLTSQVPNLMDSDQVPGNNLTVKPETVPWYLAGQVDLIPRDICGDALGPTTAYSVPTDCSGGVDPSAQESEEDLIDFETEPTSATPQPTKEVNDDVDIHVMDFATTSGKSRGNSKGIRTETAYRYFEQEFGGQYKVKRANAMVRTLSEARMLLQDMNSAARGPTKGYFRENGKLGCVEVLFFYLSYE